MNLELYNNENKKEFNLYLIIRKKIQPELYLKIRSKNMGDVKIYDEKGMEIKKKNYNYIRTEINDILKSGGRIEVNINLKNAIENNIILLGENIEC